MKNPFNHLRMPGNMFAQVDAGTMSEVPVYTDSRETVYVLTARCGDAWAAGYWIIYADGERRREDPSAVYGLYRTEEDARTFMVAAIAERAPVADATREALERMTLRSMQGTLF